jgi:hypothetical protein
LINHKTRALRQYFGQLWLPHEKPSTCGFHATPRQPDERGSHRDRHKTIDSVDHPTMPRNETTGVLDPVMTLHRRLEQITRLFNDGE